MIISLDRVPEPDRGSRSPAVGNRVGLSVSAECSRCAEQAAIQSGSRSSRRPIAAPGEYPCCLRYPLLSQALLRRQGWSTALLLSRVRPSDCRPRLRGRNAPRCLRPAAAPGRSTSRRQNRHTISSEYLSHVARADRMALHGLLAD
jgi:hypothetical protein